MNKQRRILKDGHTLKEDDKSNTSSKKVDNHQIDESNLPIDTIEFWYNRVITAIATGKELHTIIYNTDYQNWCRIQQITDSVIRTNIIEGSSILDVGCGYGALLELIPADKYDYLGIDLSPDLINVGKIRYPNAKLSVGCMPQYTQSLYEDKSFDYAICRSIKGMFDLYNKSDQWESIHRELNRVSKNIILLEYEDPTEYRIMKCP